MKLQGKKTGAFADFIGYVTQASPTIDLSTGEIMLTVRYTDAGNPCYKDYKTIAEFNADWEDYTPDEPEPGYLVAKIQKLENSVKTLDGRLKEQAKKMDTLRDGINEIRERLKTTEEITERLLGEDNDRIIGKVKSYEPGLPPREAFKRMKEQLREWIEKNNMRSIRIDIRTEPDGRRSVQFTDRTNAGDNRLIIIGWPTIGLVDGAIYKPEELLITGEAGEE